MMDLVPILSTLILVGVLVAVVGVAAVIYLVVRLVRRSSSAGTPPGPSRPG